ncbi:MAG: methionine adenosyltransferase [Treponema sp.]|nr:methionine adenosyltransferase [Treponema sp.]
MGFILSNKKYHLFTSESVSEGHPDKVCDAISDAILDRCLELDKDCRVACETFVTTDFVLVGGEIGFKTNSDENLKIIEKEVEKIARKVVAEIGYTDSSLGFDAQTFQFVNKLHTQSLDISQGVDGEGLDKYKGEQGAGDQGMMFGFACNETAEFMPATIIYAHQLLRKATQLRKSGKISWLRPDAKSQVTIKYNGNKPVHIDSVVVSHQHAVLNDDVKIEHDEIERVTIEEIIKPVLEPTGLFDNNTKIYVNPTGRFVTGGPHGDSGLTGRKIIVDTYGGMGRHGGGAFSGKDSSKVDRSAAYMARYIAKNIVAAQLAERAEVQLAYAIGVPHPVSIMVETFGTEKVSVEKIVKAVEKIFDCTPAGIVKILDLKKPVFKDTSNYGHFGRNEFTWEKTDKAQELKQLCK